MDFLTTFESNDYKSKLLTYYNNNQAKLNSFLTKARQLIESQNLLKMPSENETEYKKSLYYRSLFQAIDSLAQWNLIPGKQYGHVDVHVESNTTKDGSKYSLVVCRPMYQGLQELAYRHPKILGITADVVREGDYFEEMNCVTPPHHQHTAKGDAAIIKAYCVVSLQGGAYQIEVISKEEIDKIRKKAKTNAIWTEWFEEKCKVTVIRRALKHAPKTQEYQEFEELDNEEFDLSSSQTATNNKLKAIE